MEENNKKPHCPSCTVPDETIQKLKNSATENEKSGYETKHEKKERERSAKIRANKTKKVAIWAAVAVVAVGLIFGVVRANSYFALKQANSPKITVYYSTTCSCCKQYITYLRANGFNVNAIADGDILSVKEKYNVSSDVEGCHTSVIDNYVVEGMVPYQAINKMLADKPAIDGIALPGMPNKAPGMPGYDGSYLTVLQLQDGSSSQFSY
ncbi:MAG: DUF411 domain-containing protein [Candidatus Staskawiczbacteria bacterium]|nr:DUF411 domain-containing protein [Candidatus Staskawiczbacteria bacterium]